MLVLNAMSHSIVARDIEEKKEGWFSRENVMSVAKGAALFAIGYAAAWYARGDGSGEGAQIPVTTPLRQTSQALKNPYSDLTMYLGQTTFGDVLDNGHVQAIYQGGKEVGVVKIILTP